VNSVFFILNRILGDYSKEGKGMEREGGKGTVREGRKWRGWEGAIPPLASC